jgi:hypothetical protein
MCRSHNKLFFEFQNKLPNLLEALRKVNIGLFHPYSELQENNNFNTKREEKKRKRKTKRKRKRKYGGKD